MPDTADTHPHSHTHDLAKPPSRLALWVQAGALGWPAWLRVLLVCPALLVLWLMVYWANPAIVSW